MTEFPLEQFLTWLRAQGEREFNYYDNENCVVASFAKEVLNCPGPYCTPSHIKLKPGVRLRLPWCVNNGVVRAIQGGSGLQSAPVRADHALEEIEKYKRTFGEGLGVC